MSLEMVGFAVGLLGLVPLGHAAWIWAGNRLPARALLRMTRAAPLDIVLTTNGIQEEDWAGGVTVAYLTAVGEVRGVAAVSRVLNSTYPHKKPAVYMNDDYTGKPQGDILLIGGPRRNRWSKYYLETIERDYDVEIDLDAEGRRLQIGDLVFESFDQQLVDGVPTEDLGMVVIGPWSGDRSRTVVLCGGFSTYGTEAAAQFIFSDLLHDRGTLRRINREFKSNEVAIIGVHCLVASRQVQRTSIAKINNEDMVWVGCRRTDVP